MGGWKSHVAAALLTVGVTAMSTSAGNAGADPLPGGASGSAMEDGSAAAVLPMLSAALDDTVSCNPIPGSTCTSYSHTYQLSVPNHGDTSSCRFAARVDWGDGKNTQVEYAGTTGGSVGTTINHRFDATGTYLIAVSGTVTAGDCGFNGYVEGFELLRLPWQGTVSAEFAAKATSIAEQLRMSPGHLMAAMAFETGETFSPSVENRAGSGAVGLLQFMPSTARALGTTTEKLTKMTAVEQLDYVEKYLHRFTGKLNTIEDAYSAVLLPKLVGKPADTVAFKKGTVAYRQNSSLDANNDGIITKAEAALPVRNALERGKTR